MSQFYEVDDFMVKGNPNHDPKTGEFSSGMGGELDRIGWTKEKFIENTMNPILAERMKHGWFVTKVPGGVWSWKNPKTIDNSLDDSLNVSSYSSRTKFGRLVRDMGVTSIHQGDINHPLHDYVGGYVGAMSFFLNEMLRKGYNNAVDPDSEIYTRPSLAEADKQIKKITDYIDKYKIPRETLVYRGLTTKATDFVDSLKLGDEVIDKGFLSTSMYKQIASQFAQDETEVFHPKTGQPIFSIGKTIQIILPKGTPAVPIVQAESEAEVLVQRGSRLKVLPKVGGLIRVLRL